MQHIDIIQTLQAVVYAYLVTNLTEYQMLINPFYRYENQRFYAVHELENLKR